MQYKEISALSPEERDAQLIIEQETLRELRFAHAISPIENPMRLRHSKRLIAKFKTSQNGPSE